MGCSTHSWDRRWNVSFVRSGARYCPSRLAIKHEAVSHRPLSLSFEFTNSRTAEPSTDSYTPVQRTNRSYTPLPETLLTTDAHTRVQVEEKEGRL